MCNSHYSTISVRINTRLIKRTSKGNGLRNTMSWVLTRTTELSPETFSEFEPFPQERVPSSSQLSPSFKCKTTIQTKKQKKQKVIVSGREKKTLCNHPHTSCCMMIDRSCSQSEERRSERVLRHLLDSNLVGSW